MILTKINYVEVAEDAILSMGYRGKDGKWRIGITTSKIRNLLAMISELYNEAIHLPGNELDSDILSTIQYLKMRFAYEAGREHNVMEFVNKAKIFQVIDEIGNSKENLIIFSHYMESLVAYRKFHFGNDD